MSALDTSSGRNAIRSIETASVGQTSPMSADEQSLCLRRLRAWTAFFIFDLVVSGLTAIPLETELAVLERLAGHLRRQRRQRTALAEEPEGLMLFQERIHALSTHTGRTCLDGEQVVLSPEQAECRHEAGPLRLTLATTGRLQQRPGAQAHLLLRGGDAELAPAETEAGASGYGWVGQGAGRASVLISGSASRPAIPWTPP